MDRTPLDRALTRVGDRWTLLIVDALLAGPRRYGELAEAVTGIAPNVLAARLRKLEQDRLVVSTPYSTRPLRSQYELTADGRALAAALDVLAGWASRVDATGEDETFHDRCGTALELRRWCRTCGEVVDDDHVEQLDRF